jgi:geranylgeranyl pyrophosphate synthase
MLVIHALAEADEKGRKRLKEILMMHTKDRKLISEAIAIIGKCDSEEYTKNLEEKLVKDAWKNVERLLPDSEPKSILKSIAEFLINRSI